MLKKCKLRMWEENPTIDIEDGTTIPYEKIGWIASQYGGYPEDVFYEKMSKEDIKFICNPGIKPAIIPKISPIKRANIISKIISNPHKLFYL